MYVAVDVIDPYTFGVKAVKVGKKPWGVAVDRTAGELYVTNSGSGSVSVLDASTDRVIKTIRVMFAPKGIAADGEPPRLFSSTVSARLPRAKVSNEQQRRILPFAVVV